jgi:uncharacterized RDD family membrane protein YckC
MRSYTDEILTPPPMVNTAIPAGADFSIRLGARLIDFVFGNFILAVIAGIIGGIALVVMQELGRAPENWADLLQGKNFWTYFYGILGTVLYHWFAEGIGGTSLGKLCLGLRVVHFDGRSCEFFPAFKRSLAYFMDALFFGLIAWESMKKSILRQRYGDVWANTVVVKKTLFSPTPKPPVWKIILGNFLGAALWGAAHIASMFATVYGL